MCKKTNVVVSLVATLALFAGCASMPTNTLQDPLGNVTRDPDLHYLDIASAGAQIAGDVYILWVQTGAAFPPASDMAVGKRIDFIFFIDADENTQTGQSDKGNDYNIHLYYDETGWHPSFYKVSPVAEADGVSVNMGDFRIESGGAEAPYFVRLRFLARYLPYDRFEWWVTGATLNAPTWLPYTENPPTQRARFLRM